MLPAGPISSLLAASSLLLFRQSTPSAHLTEIGVGDVVLVSSDAPAHRNAGLVHGLGRARDQRMPPLQVLALGDQPIAAGRRQPFDAAHGLRRQLDAVADAAAALL